MVCRYGKHPLGSPNVHNTQRETSLMQPKPQKDKHYTFEDTKTSSDPTSAQSCVQEWLDTIERAKDIAISQNLTNSYSGEDAFNTSNMSSHSSSMVGDVGITLLGMGG